MPPAKIMLVRHGEKQESPPPAGVDEQGAPDKHALIPRGWQRAGALVPFFRGRIPNPAIAPPTAIFAAAVGDAANVTLLGAAEAKSLRPQETVAPLARALGITVNANFMVGDETHLAAAIRALDGVVLVAWEHKHIPLIARIFSATSPQEWPGGDVFDIVWVLDHAGTTYTYRSINQSLLDGDT